MIKINERTYVAAQYIKQVSKPEGYNYVRVVMVDGEMHTVEPLTEESVDDVFHRLVTAVRGDA